MIRELDQATPLPKLLLVEDDREDAEAVNRLLRRRNAVSSASFELIHCDRLQAALDAVRTDEVSVVLLDLELPDSTGLETARRILEVAPHIPVLVLTGTDDHQLGVEAVREGAQDFLQKSQIASDALVRAIQYAIERNQVTTAQRRLDERLLIAQKLESLGVLAGGIAHDFNNLLSSIIGHVALALHGTHPEAPFRHDLMQISRVAQQAADLTRQLLAYSGKGRFVVEAVDLTALVRDMEHLLKASVSKQVSIRYTLEAGLSAVEADATQLRQVIMNLVTNAAEASEGRGNVGVFTGAVEVDRDYLHQLQIEEELPAGRYVFLEVSDSGRGMSPETQARMFDPFFTTKNSGRGLGLAAARGIVEGHRGAIKVYSQLGHGTAIKILLPATEAVARQLVNEEEGLVSWEARGTVLIIDDEEHVREVAEAILTRFGVRVLVADGGRAGIEAFVEHHGEIDAVLLDMTMPDIEGPEVFQELLRVDPNAKVLLTSGYSEQDAMSRFAGRGLAGFVAKPFSMNDLAKKFRDVLSGKPERQTP